MTAFSLFGVKKRTICCTVTTTENLFRGLHQDAQLARDCMQILSSRKPALVL